MSDVTLGTESFFEIWGWKGGDGEGSTIDQTFLLG